MKQLFLYVFILMVIVPQIVFSQGFGNCPFGNYPFGNCTSEGDRSDTQPRIPFIIGIKVYFDDKPLNHTLTEIINLNTGESDTEFTNFNGEVVYELSNFETRYSQGDIIEINVCINDNRCKEETRNYTVSNSGGIIAIFRLPTKQDDVVIPPIGDEKSEPPIQDTPKNDNVEIIYINDSSIINATIYIDNSTQVNKYINYSINVVNNIVNNNYFFPITITIAISFGITFIFKILRKRKNKK